MKIREYKGEEVVAQLSARLVPPSSDYPDCICELVMSKRHLYVLEDNYDGSWTFHFSFVLPEIDDVCQEVYAEKAEKNSGETHTNMLAAVLGNAAGIGTFFYKGQRRTGKRAYFVICYHTEQGNAKKIYFTEYEDSRAKDFGKAFQKERAVCGGALV